MPDFRTAIISGGVAGTAVDVALYPLDTIKTRLQTSQGFWASGGFRGIYNGLGAAAIGSAPGAALFFSTYEATKTALSDSKRSTPVVHMLAASVGEAVACIVRVPTEIVKQRMQAGQHTTLKATLMHIVKSDGLFGFYRGYLSMLAREVPFALIQFPLWEKLKIMWGEAQSGAITPMQGALCGSVAGTVAAAVTTPLDVVKTRLMLGKDANGKIYDGAWSTGRRIVTEEGARTLFAGIGPRTMWIGIGGFVFFGMYENTVSVIEQWNEGADENTE